MTRDPFLDPEPDHRPGCAGVLVGLAAAVVVWTLALVIFGAGAVVAVVVLLAVATLAAWLAGPAWRLAARICVPPRALRLGARR